MTPGERQVRLALVLSDGTPLGMTPWFGVPASSYWPDAEVIVAGARRELGIRPIVLRLVSVTDGDPERAVHAAEVDAVPDLLLDPVDPAILGDDALRMPWARPGGPERYLAWARSALDDAGAAITGPFAQIRTWNLSMLWRVPTDRGAVWLKAVPPFFAHEGAVLERLQSFAVPPLLACGPDAVLLLDVPGDDRYRPTEAVATRMTDLLVDIQTRVDVATLPPMPVWTPASLVPAAKRALELAPELSDDDRRAVAAVIDGLPGLQSELDDCGLPDTLVHGDYHPGNLRGDDDDLVILDWGDSGIGHPLLDMAAFTERMPAPAAATVVEHWLQAWRHAVPGSDPARALALLAPYGALRQATLYRGFLDRIEASEHIYHRDDPATWLRRAAALARTG